MKIERKKEIKIVRISHNWKLLIVILILLVILGILIYFILQNRQVNQGKNNNSIKECSVDSDCVKASCCHADSCVTLDKKPSCNGVFCSADCESVLDCGAGYCGCVNGKCNVIAEIK